ncbi:homoserine dehydrogenase [Paenactinomyces guangxiensis]|uniref:Homoserine dehydrogenase n=1 Tax=Paenactinomyces guangxiensis TaxID=1490290 RepID=A0A7W1WMP9_9BACL|nr:homoserine dehydrogenase [Paenactinomyces guangxiensis]MBA4492762.1 homoserine dehydrogenase [Paenactinomyces guangxiensis]MBH8590389.1 homoserine dehydrogenase [Paenactinomyces guangxiensis]
MEQVNVALLGLGTVGTGVWKMLESNQDVIARRTGRFFNIQTILVKDLGKKREINRVGHLLTDQFADVLQKDVQIVIEVMGGIEPARTYMRQAIEKGCHIITANKELMAKHGVELEQLANEKGVQLLYEASVGGGIPVIGTLQHFLKANRIYKISGILNGTTNYILTQMNLYHRDFDDVLQEAQAKGYAEADPTSDVEGYDAAYKLAILSRLVFGAHIPVSEISRKGITDVTAAELKMAGSLGYTVKLLAQAEQYGENGPISCSVNPALLPLSHPLASVNDVYNAIYVEGDQIQDLTLVGQGAGEKPTASAVVEDLCNLHRLPSTRSLSPIQPLLFAGGEEGCTRFVFIRTRKPLNDQEVEAYKLRLQRVGIEVLKWTLTVEETGEALLALLAKGWESALEPVGLSELGVEIQESATRPVVLGNALTQVENVHPAVGATSK